MTDMLPPDPFDDNDAEIDPEDKIRMDAFNLSVERINVQTEGFIEALKKLGLYVEMVHVQPVDTPFGPQPALVVAATVGRVAFTDRTLDPEQADIDRQFREIDHGSTQDTVNEDRERIKRNIAAGRDPLDDGDEDV